MEKQFTDATSLRKLDLFLPLFPLRKLMQSSFDRWIAVKAPQKVKSLTLASPGWREEEDEVCASLEAIREALFINKTGRGGDDSGTLPDEPLSDICAYFIGALPRLADAREQMRVFFQKRCKSLFFCMLRKPLALRHHRSQC